MAQSHCSKTELTLHQGLSKDRLESSQNFLSLIQIILYTYTCQKILLRLSLKQYKAKYFSKRQFKFLAFISFQTHGVLFRIMNIFCAFDII